MTFRKNNKKQRFVSDFNLVPRAFSLAWEKALGTRLIRFYVSELCLRLKSPVFDSRPNKGVETSSVKFSTTGVQG